MRCPRLISHGIFLDETHFDHFCLERLPDPIFTSPQGYRETILALSDPKLPQLGPEMVQLGPKLDTTSPQLGPSLAPT